MRGIVPFSFLFVVAVLVVVYGVIAHLPVLSIIFAVFSILLFCAVAYDVVVYAYERGINRGTGLIKDEKELLEDNEIYEALGFVRIPSSPIFDSYGSIIAVLRLRSGEFRACRMASIPPKKVFKVRKNKGGSLEALEYPPESLSGEIIDIKV